MPSDGRSPAATPGPDRFARSRRPQAPRRRKHAKRRTEPGGNAGTRPLRAQPAPAGAPAKERCQATALTWVGVLGRLHVDGPGTPLLDHDPFVRLWRVRLHDHPVGPGRHWDRRPADGPPRDLVAALVVDHERGAHGLTDGAAEVVCVSGVEERAVAQARPAPKLVPGTLGGHAEAHDVEARIHALFGEV